MRHLLNTLYVTSEDVYLALDGENVLVLRGEDTVGRFPLHGLEAVVSFSYKGASPALMGACVQRGIGLHFYTPHGRYLASAQGEPCGNVLLRRIQYRSADLEQTGLGIARCMIAGKLYNSRWVLERALRDHGLRIDEAAVRGASARLAQAARKAADCPDMETLRGLEGDAAADYFGVFDQLILQNKEDFHFCGRTRRPPLDRTNALLSFFYSMLANDCAAALNAVGLDPYVGFMHTDRPGRRSLALDLEEELRSPLADRFVLSLINQRIVKASQFEVTGSGAVFLNDEGRKAALTAWQNRKKEELTHPFLGEKLSWGLVPYVQAQLLARYLRGDLDAYPPFLWK